MSGLAANGPALPEEAALVVEDDALLRSALAARLGERGLVPRAAADRKAALEQAEGCLLAIIDLGLPPLPDSPEEGLRLIEMLNLVLPHMPLIVLTGQDEEASALAAIECGAFDFLAKPVDGAALDQAIERALRFARARRQLQRQGADELRLTARELAQGLREASALAQEKLVRQAIIACGGNYSHAARRLGITRSQLYYYLDKFGIMRPADDAG